MPDLCQFIYSLVLHWGKSLGKMKQVLAKWHISKRNLPPKFSQKHYQTFNKSAIKRKIRTVSKYFRGVQYCFWIATNIWASTIYHGLHRVRSLMINGVLLWFFLAVGRVGPQIYSMVNIFFFSVGWEYTCLIIDKTSTVSST